MTGVKEKQIPSLRGYFAQSPDLFCEIDEHGRFLYINASWKDRLGWLPTDVVGLPFIEFVHPDDVEVSVRTFGTHDGSGRTIINRYRDHSGEYRHLEWTGYFDSTLKMALCHAREVTAKVRADRLLESIAKIQAEYIQVQDRPEDFFLSALKHAMEWTGCESGFIAESVSKVPKKNPLPLVRTLAMTSTVWFKPESTEPNFDSSYNSDPELRILLDTFSSALEGRGNSTIIHSKLEGMKNGLVVPLRIGSETVGVLGLANRANSFDATEVAELSPYIESLSSLLAAYRLSKSESDASERLRTIAENLPVMLTEFDSKGNFTWLNNAFIRLIGYTVEDFRVDNGKQVFLLTEPGDRERAVQFMLSGSDQWSEFAMLSKDGTRVDSIWRNVKLKGGNRIGIGLDIRDRKVSEAALIQSSKMASLGEMSAGVSHEINNPLTIIQGGAFRALNNLRPESTNLDEVREDLNRVIQNCDRIARIVRGLRAFSRSDEHEPFRPVPLSVIVEDMVDLGRERLKSHKIELNLDVQFGGMIECRSVQLGQVLMNLMNNSYDAVFGQPKGDILIRCFEVQGPSDGALSKRAPANSKWVRIEFEDSGPGISLQHQSRLMEPFFTTKEVGKGTGLGLSISKGIIESHGGAFFLDSSSKRTRFVIELPQKQK